MIRLLLALSTEKYTQILESALSRLGILVGNEQNKEANDYVLTGDVVSLRMGEVRNVPDGTKRNLVQVQH